MSITEKLTARAAQAAPTGMTLVDYLRSQKGRLAQALPKHLTAERLLNVVLTSIRTTPHLADCTPPSLVAAVMHCAALGVEPGPLQHAYLIPYWNKRLGQYEAVFMLGYRGLIDLARRSGNIVSIAAHEVYESDVFELVYGTEERLIHKPAWAQRTGVPGLYYAIAHLVGGGYHMEVMTRADVEAIRQRSRAADNGPWVTDFNEMAKKTVTRRLCKYLPLSVEVQYQLLRDQDGLADGPTHAALVDDLLTAAPEAVSLTGEAVPVPVLEDPGPAAPPAPDAGPAAAPPTSAPRPDPLPFEPPAIPVDPTLEELEAALAAHGMAAGELDDWRQAVAKGAPPADWTAKQRQAYQRRLAKALQALAAPQQTGLPF